MTRLKRRKEIARQMDAAGVPQKKIAKALGVNERQVRRDLTADKKSSKADKKSASKKKDDKKEQIRRDLGRAGKSQSETKKSQSEASKRKDDKKEQVRRRKISQGVRAAYKRSPKPIRELTPVLEDEQDEAKYLRSLGLLPRQIDVHLSRQPTAEEHEPPRPESVGAMFGRPGRK